MLKKLLASQLRINMATGVVTHCINIVVLAVSYPVYLHFLGYERYGLWLALGAVLAFTRLGELGMAQAVTKLVAEEHGRGNTQVIQRHVATAILILCIISGIILAVILIFKVQIISAFKFTEETSKLAIWLLPYIVVLSIYTLVVQVLMATLAGLGRMDLSNYIETGGRIVLVSVAIPLLYLGYGLKSLLFATAFSYLAKHLLSLFLIRRTVAFRLLKFKNISKYCIKKLLHIGSRLSGGSIVRMVGVPFNKFMLARFAGVESLPVFDIAWQGAIQIRNLIEIALRALMPEVSRISANMTRYAKDRISQISHRAMKLIFLFGIPMYVAMLIFATPLLRIWLREKFDHSIPFAFRIMLVATFINLLGVPSYYLLLGMGRIRAVFATSCITWLTSMALVTMIAVNRNCLSVSVVCMCLIISWSLSSTYIIWRFRRALTEVGASLQ